MHALLKAHMHIYILLRSRVRLVSLTRREKIEKPVCFAYEKEMRRQSKYTHEPGLRILCFCVQTSFICGDGFWVGIDLFRGGHVIFGYYRKQRSTSFGISKMHVGERKLKAVQKLFRSCMSITQGQWLFTRVRVR